MTTSFFRSERTSAHHTRSKGHNGTRGFIAYSSSCLTFVLESRANNGSAKNRAQTRLWRSCGNFTPLSELGHPSLPSRPLVRVRSASRGGVDILAEGDAIGARLSLSPQRYGRPLPASLSDRPGRQVLSLFFSNIPGDFLSLHAFSARVDRPLHRQRRPDQGPARKIDRDTGNRDGHARGRPQRRRGRVALPSCCEPRLGAAGHLCEMKGNLKSACPVNPNRLGPDSPSV